jgi:hypothetical protein
MFQFHGFRRIVVLLTCVFALTHSVVSTADDVVSFATGGYAPGLRTKEMMDKIDTNRDGTISQ